LTPKNGLRKHCTSQWWHWKKIRKTTYCCLEQFARLS